jgi:hypothetical protein
MYYHLCTSVRKYIRRRTWVEKKVQKYNCLHEKHKSILIKRTICIKLIKNSREKAFAHTGSRTRAFHKRQYVNRPLKTESYSKIIIKNLQRLYRIRRALSRILLNPTFLASFFSFVFQSLLRNLE